MPFALHLRNCGVPFVVQGRRTIRNGNAERTARFRRHGESSDNMHRHYNGGAEKTRTDGIDCARRARHNGNKPSADNGKASRNRGKRGFPN